MKKNLIILIGFLSISAQAQVKEAFLEKWEHSKQYMLDIVEAMPKEKFDYKPTSREMTFLEQVKHIKQNMEWLGSTYFNAPPTDVMIMNDLKAQTKANLSNAFDQVTVAINHMDDATLSEMVDFKKGKLSKLQILNLIQDHVTHHRGQLIVYLNLNDIAPPPYIGW